MKWGHITVKKQILQSSLAKSFLRIKASFVRFLGKQLIQVFREDPIFGLDTGKSKSTTRSNRCCLEFRVFIFLCFVLFDDNMSHLQHFYIYLYIYFFYFIFSILCHFAWKYNYFVNFCFHHIVFLFLYWNLNSFIWSYSSIFYSGKLLQELEIHIKFFNKLKKIFLKIKAI